MVVKNKGALKRQKDVKVKPTVRKPIFRNSLKSFKKKSVISILALAMFASAGHISAQKFLGRAYSKRIPFVGRYVHNQNSFDFYLHNHASKKGLNDLENLTFLVS